MGLDDNESSLLGTTARPAPPASWDVRRLGLMALVGITSLAVGATTSYWFVPPYLLAMGFLLGGPRPDPARAVAAEPAPAPAAEPIAPGGDPASTEPEPRPNRRARAALGGAAAARSRSPSRSPPLRP